MVERKEFFLHNFTGIHCLFFSIIVNISITARAQNNLLGKMVISQHNDSGFDSHLSHILKHIIVLSSKGDKKKKFYSYRFCFTVLSHKF